jgi:hypothetical protein
MFCLSSNIPDRDNWRTGHSVRVQVREIMAKWRMRRGQEEAGGGKGVRGSVHLAGKGKVRLCEEILSSLIPLLPPPLAPLLKIYWGLLSPPLLRGGGGAYYSFGRQATGMGDRWPEAWETGDLRHGRQDIYSTGGTGDLILKKFVYGHLRDRRA